MPSCGLLAAGVRRAGCHDEQISYLAVGDEHFGAVEDEACAMLLGLEADAVGGVGGGFFEHGQGDDGLASADVGDNLASLFIVACFHDGEAAEDDGGEEGDGG